MARTRADQPDGLETATDANAETAETLSSPDVAAADGPQDPPAEDTPVPAADDSEQRTRYRVVRGSISYPVDGEERNADAGDEIDDISDDDAAWLLADGILERI